MPPEANRMATKVARLNTWPEGIRRWVLTRIARASVPFVGTAGIEVLELTQATVKLRLRNRKRARNHIGGVHAAAIALLAETASGFVVGMNLPEHSLPLLRKMDIEYVERARGDLAAEATFDTAQSGLLEAERGEILVAVRVWSADGTEPVICRMLWAWVPKRR